MNSPQPQPPTQPKILRTRGGMEYYYNEVGTMIITKLPPSKPLVPGSRVVLGDYAARRLGWR